MQVAASPTVEACFTAWDVGTTDQLLGTLEEQRNKRLERETALKQKEENKLVFHLFCLSVTHVRTAVVSVCAVFQFTV